MNCTVFQKHKLRSPPAWTARRTLSFPILCTSHQLQCSCYLVITDIHKINKFKHITLKERNAFLFFKCDINFAGCNRRNLLYFGRTFCKLNYIGITILTHIWSWTVMEVMTRQILNKTGSVHTVCPTRYRTRLFFNNFTTNGWRTAAPCRNNQAHYRHILHFSHNERTPVHISLWYLHWC